MEVEGGEMEGMRGVGSSKPSAHENVGKKKEEEEERKGRRKRGR